MTGAVRLVMLKKTSMPSRRRAIAAWSIYIAGGLLAVAWKIGRDNSHLDADLVSSTLIGVMPNFLPAAVLPALVFIRPCAVSLSEYLGVSLAILIALCAYEIAQIWIASRTFDLGDVVASVVGCCVGCLIGWCVFFEWFEKCAD